MSIPQRPAPPEAVLCPFCGMAQFTQDVCSACLQPMNDRGRKQAQIDMGPWFVRDKANPFAPGCSYEKMKRLAAEGVLTAKSIVRGPSTLQFWLMAKFTPGISHLVGHCFTCPATAQASDACCAVCRVPFKDYPDRNALGLRYKTEAEVQAARKELAVGSAAAPTQSLESASADEAPKAILPPQQAVMGVGESDAIPFIPGVDLLDKVFGKK